MRNLFAVALVGLLTSASIVAQSTPQQAAHRPATPVATIAAQKPEAGLPTEATVNSFLRRMFGYDSSIEWKVLSITRSEAPGVASVLIAMNGPKGAQNIRFHVLPGGKWAATGDLMPFGADPFAPVRTKLEAEARGPARGPAQAAITIVEFSDLQCPACKAAQPVVERLLNDFPNAHFVFQNFPLEQLHPWAFRAATYADCVGRENNEAFWKFVHAVYENQEQVTTENVDQKLGALAQQAGVNAARTAACAAQPATAERVRQSEALGMEVNVNGTPTVFVNGREIPNVTGIPYELLKALVKGTPK